jgi:hypothetical protein
MKGYWYLGSQYSLHPKGLDAAFADAARAAALFVKAGVPVLSPITHSHPIAVMGEIDPRDHQVWMPVDHPLMAGAIGLVVLMTEGWESSYGLKVEIDQFKSARKPVVFMIPGILPELP